MPRSSRDGGLITNLAASPPKALAMASPCVTRDHEPYSVERVKPIPIGREVALGQCLTETGGSWIVQTAQVGTEFISPGLIAIHHPAQFLGPHGQVGALYRAEVAQPRPGHVPEHFRPPAAPVSQPGA